LKDADRVTIVTLGGTGHEPAISGFVGGGMVGISVAEKEGHRIGWGKYCKAAVPATLIVVLISMIVIFIRYGDLLMM